MPSLTVIDREGNERVLEGQAGLSVMEIIRDSGIDELLALCGGCCSCATCHVYVEGDGVASLPAPSDDENDLLESSEFRQPNSRLSCQVAFTNDLDGLTLKIAPED